MHTSSRRKLNEILSYVLNFFHSREDNELSEVADRAVRKAAKLISHEENDENPMDECIDNGVALVFWVIVGCALGFGVVLTVIIKFIKPF